MIKISDLTKKFGPTIVLDGVNLELSTGVYGLLGPNGAGKTTLMRCLTGFYQETKPAITFTEGDPRIGYLPQSFGLMDHLTACESLALLARLKEIPSDQITSQIHYVLESVNLLDRKNDRVSTLSGGMIRRLGIAQTLLGSPPVRLYDEPTAGLDPEERLRFHNVIRKNADKGITIISTHIVEDIEISSENVIILSKGKVLAVGSVSEVKACADGLVYETEDFTSLTDSDVLIRNYEKSGGTVTRFLSPDPKQSHTRKISPSLEDAFIAITRGMVNAI